MSFDLILKKRASIRKYSTKKVSIKDVLEMADAARHSPMAGNIFTIRLIIVGDKEKKTALSEAALKQSFIAEASYVIVVCSDITTLSRSYAHQAEKYARQQAGASIENMLLKATELGLAACWVGAFDENGAKDILKIPDNIHVEALIPIGNPVGKTEQRKKPDLKFISYFEKWGQKEAKPLHKPE